jgi:hypothetical protein
MFTDEPQEYLLAFKEFLLRQQGEKEDPAVPALIAEIERELSARTTNAM